MTEQEPILQEVLDNMAQMKGELVALQTVIKLIINALSIGDPDKYMYLKCHIFAILDEFGKPISSENSNIIKSMRGAFIYSLAILIDDTRFDLKSIFSVINGGNNTH